MNPIPDYLQKIEKALAAGNATEHTYRPALQALLESMEQDIGATNEPKRVEEAIAVTVTALMKNLCKSPASLRNTLSLLKLPNEIQGAVKTGQIGVSQGYIFEK